MELNSARLKRNAGLLYSLIIILGAVLSTFVYTSTQTVKQNTLILVDQDIKVFERLQVLNTLFIEQELYLNEYYANQDRGMYLDNFVKTAEQIEIKLLELNDITDASEQVRKLEALQLSTVELAIDFDQNMAFGDANSGEMWDLARSHLENLAKFRQQLSPVISNIISETNLRINTQYENTKMSLDRTIQIVLAYSLLIIVLAYFVGQAIKNSIQVSVKNKRLALFPERNPNPILSLDTEQNIQYLNPAMTDMLDKLNLTMDQFMAYLASPLSKCQKSIIVGKIQHQTIELNVLTTIIECDIHWLNDIENWDLHFVDVTEKKMAETQLVYQAFHDQETGLYNKNQFVADLDVICTKPVRHAIGLIEVRSYSQLVSRLGLALTSNVIEQLARVLELDLANLITDGRYSLYRTSEKQFALVMETQACSIQIAELVTKIEGIVEGTIFDNGVNLELDFGFTCFPDHTDDSQSIIKSATIALDSAISINHSSLVVYSEQLGGAISKEIELTNKLRLAIENQSMELYFQPQLDIQQNKIIGVETLIRWQNDGGFITPDQFIPLAEKTGLIVPLGDWILLNACQKATQLIQLGYADIVVAINISPQQFNHPSFYDTVVSVLAETKVPAENIELEITEGVIMYNESETISMLHKLKDTGVKLSIDDFGTGYSSLSYLKQFPIDKLKIDQSFIKQIEQNDDDKAIVSTVIDLGNNLGLTLIAEGVEEQSHLDILTELGCQEIQGYYFSRPLPSSNLDQFLKDFSQTSLN